MSPYIKYVSKTKLLREIRKDNHTAISLLQPKILLKSQYILRNIVRQEIWWILFWWLIKLIIKQQRVNFSEKALLRKIGPVLIWFHQRDSSSSWNTEAERGQIQAANRQH